MARNNRYRWEDTQRYDLGDASSLIRSASNAGMGMFDDLTKVGTNFFDKRSATLQQNTLNQSKANTADIIDQIRNGKDPKKEGFYDLQKIVDAKYENDKYNRTQSRLDARLALAQNRYNRGNTDTNALGDFYNSFDTPYDTPTVEDQPATAFDNVIGRRYNDVVLNGQTVPTGDGNSVVLNAQTAPYSEEVPAAIEVSSLDSVLDNRIDTPTTTAEAMLTLSDQPPVATAEDSPYQYTASAGVVTANDFIPREENYQDEPAGVQSIAGNPWDKPTDDGSKFDKNAITTSTVNIDGVDYEVNEDRRQRIVNQRENKVLLKSTEKRNYDRTRAFAKKHPRLAKRAFAGYKAWRKDFRSNFKTNNELTADEKQVIKDSVIRDSADYFNSMGYDKNGKPFVKKSKVDERKALFEQKKAEAEYWNKKGYNANGTSLRKGTKKSKEIETTYNKPNELVLGTSTLKAAKAAPTTPTIPDKNITFADRVEGTPVPAPAPAIPAVAPVLKTPEEEPSFIDNAVDTVGGWFGGDDKTHEQKLEETLPDMRSQEMRDAGMSKKEIQAEYKRRDMVQKAHELGSKKKTWNLDDLYSKDMKPTEYELKSMPRELVMKLRGGYSSHGTPVKNKVFLDRGGNPVIKNGNFVYVGGDGTPTAFDKSGYKYSPPLENGPLTAEELNAENKEMLKLLPKGTKLLKDGRALAPNGKIYKRKR